MASRSTLAPPIPGARQQMTEEEFWAWAPGEALLTEWVDGEGFVYVPTTERHAAIVWFVGRLIDGFARLNDLGRVYLGPYSIRLPSRPSVREPDVFFVAKVNQARITNRTLEGPADLAVEVVSGDSVHRDRVEKRGEYEATGVFEYVLIEAREGRTGPGVYRLDEAGHYQAVDPDDQGRIALLALPGLWLDTDWFGLDGPPDAEETLIAVAPDAYFAWVDAERRKLGR